MKELISVSNPIVKAAADLKQKKYRNEQQAFLVEGLRFVEDVVQCELVRQLFVLHEFEEIESARVNRVVELAVLKGAEVYAVSEAVMKKIADTETPQALTAVATKPQTTLDVLSKSKKQLLVLDRIADPGNLGTMIRTADAAGVGGVVLLAGCTDAFAPKVARSTMGSLLHIPIVEGISETDFLQWIQSCGYELLVTCLEDAENLYQTDLKGKIAMVIGSEANGASAGLLAAASKKVYIPMEGKAESLNAAVAAGAVMFECLRQRLADSGKL